MAACALFRCRVVAASFVADIAETRVDEHYPRHRHRPEVASSAFPGRAAAGSRDINAPRDDEVATDGEAVALKMLRVLQRLSRDESPIAHAIVQVQFEHLPRADVYMILLINLVDKAELDHLRGAFHGSCGGR